MPNETKTLPLNFLDKRLFRMEYFLCKHMQLF